MRQYKVLRCFLFEKKIFCSLEDRDCPDNSDEDEDRHNCQNRECHSNEFKCESGVRGRVHTKCIRRGQVCDG